MDRNQSFGAYRICLKAKRSKNRRAIEHAVETLQFLNPSMSVTWPNKNEVEVFCNNRKQANVISSHFNVGLMYLIKFRFEDHKDYYLKLEAIYNLLKERGHKAPRRECVSYTITDPHTGIRTAYAYVTCRQTAIMAKLSISTA